MIIKNIKNDKENIPEFIEDEKIEETSYISIICAIIGIFFLGIILGIIAIVLSKKPESKNKQAAFILGIVDIVLAVVGGIVFTILRNVYKLF